VSYSASWQAATNRNGQVAPLSPEFVQDYPTIAEVLMGSPAVSEGTQGTPPASIILFAEGGVLKFVISPKIGNRVAFGSIGDPVKGFTALESELQAGRYEWKIARSRKLT